jgi:sigma-B regulation protein RsbU (phosphoserine phosphatase)
MQELATQLHQLRELHTHLLPRAIPQPQGWHIATHYGASVWPGGDLYDVRQFADGGLMVFIAAANDQGAASTALAILVRAVMHTCPLSSAIVRLPFCPFSSPSNREPHVQLEHLNAIVAENKLPEQFMTAFCGMLDPADGRFQFANAGHPSARWWRAAQGSLAIVEENAGLPLGVERHVSYPPQSIVIAPGDLFVLYSDSVTAALNKGTNRFGWKLLDEALHEAASQGAEAVKAAVLARLANSPGGLSGADEVTLLVLERQSD